MKPNLAAIETKVKQGIRLSREDGLQLLNTDNLSWLGYLADVARTRASGDSVYFNVNRHINLTNICVSRCRFCAFGCDADSPASYAMNLHQIVNTAELAAQDADLGELHIVSGLHPEWPFEQYLSVLSTLKAKLPHIHLKAFTCVEICYFAKISGKSVPEVLSELKAAGLDSMPGGGAEVFSERIRQQLFPNKASAAEWLEVARTAHKLGIPTNASLLYGHIETYEERIDHLLQLRALQDETGGFQTFIGLPFHPANTCLADSVSRTSAWEDLKMVAVARLMLDNFKNIKAYWVMLTIPVAQLALAFGANDVDGTVSEEKISHAAGSKTAQGLKKEALIDLIRLAGRVPVERDSTYNVIRVYK